MNKTYLAEQDNKVHKKVRTKLDKKRRLEKDTKDKKIDKKKRKENYLKVNSIQRDYRQFDIMKIKNHIFEFCDKNPKEIENFLNIFDFLDKGKRIEISEIEDHNSKIILEKIFQLFNLIEKNGAYIKGPNLPNLFIIVKNLIPDKDLEKTTELKKHQIVKIRQKQLFADNLDESIIKMFESKKKIQKEKNNHHSSKYNNKNSKSPQDNCFDKLKFGLIQRTEKTRSEYCEVNGNKLEEIDKIFAVFEEPVKEKIPEKKSFRIIKKIN